MVESLHKQAFRDNETEANIYTAKCLRVMAAVVGAVWIMNLLGVFIVPQKIMAIAAVGSILFFMLPTLLCRLMQKRQKHLKIYLMLCSVASIGLISAAMPKHGIVVWAAPIVLSIHYYSKRFTYASLITSVLCMGISMFLGAHFGEWDVALFTDITMEPQRIFTPEIYRRLFVYMFLPRALTLLGICSICGTLADRTHTLLKKQVRDSIEKQRIASELDVATHIQTSMLPCIFPAFPEREEFDIYASMNPAREVGGDFYDFFMVDDTHLAIVMADVSDKGIPAALFMVIGKTLIKDHTTPDSDLGRVFETVNNLLCESNSEGLFITAFEGVLDLETGEFRYVNAGHELPFICRRGGEFRAEKIRPGFVLAGMENTKYTAGTFILEEGDKIFEYTDGVTEAVDAQKNAYGMNRLNKVLNDWRGGTSREIVEAVQSDIAVFSGDTPQFDDITMLCLSFKKGTGGK